MRCRVAGWRPTPLWSDSSSGVQNVLTRNQINEECLVVQRAHLKGCLPELGADWNVTNEKMWKKTSSLSPLWRRVRDIFQASCVFVRCALPCAPASLLRRHLCPKMTPTLWSCPHWFLLVLRLCLGEARSSTALERSTLTPVGESQNAGFTSLLLTDATKGFKWQWMIVRIPSDLSL